MPSSARSNSPTRTLVGLLDPGMNVIRSLEKSVTFYQSKKRNILEDMSLLVRKSVF